MAPRIELDRLVCPVCHGPLVRSSAAGVDAIDCTGCGRRYPVVDGLPVLIASRAALAGDTPGPGPSETA